MSFLKASVIIGTLMLLGKLSGLGRELALAATSGASSESDIVIVLLTFPDLVISLFLSGALASVLVPNFKNLSQQAASTLAMRVSFMIFSYFTVITLVFFVFAEILIDVLAPGWDDFVKQSAILPFRTSLLVIPIVAVSGVLVALLNSNERFGYGAIGTLLFNIVIISSLLIVGSKGIIHSVLIGIIIGVLLRFSVQLLASMPFIKRPNLTLSFDYIILIKGFLSSFIFFASISLLPAIARAYASSIEQGGLSLFNFTHKLLEVPIGIIMTAAVSVLLTRLSGLIGSGDHSRAAKLVGTIIRAIFAVLMIITISTSLQTKPIIDTVFKNASFTAEQFETLNSSLYWGLFGLPFHGLLLLLGAIYSSYDQRRYLAVTGIILVLLLNILCQAIELTDDVQDIFIAYVVSQIISVFFLLFFLNRVTGSEAFASIWYRPAVCIVFPISLCFVLSWGFSLAGLNGLLALIITISVPLWAYVVVDKPLVLLLRGRQRVLSQ